MKSKLILFLAVFSLIAGYAQKKAPKITSIPTKDIFINDLISKMTLDEKLGQLNLPTAGDITTGQVKSTNLAKRLEEGKVGGLFNIKSVAKIKDIQKVAMEKGRLKIPLIFGMDVIHGYETTFPIPLALSCSWDMPMIEKTARIAAIEATADGINWTFSPMVDICKDPRWGRIAEGGGEDAYLGSQISKAMVNGYQNGNLKNTTSMMACVKHFALYGASEAGRDYNTVDMSKLKMYNDYLSPYKAAVDAGVGSIMASFNEIDGVPATGNKWLLTDLLRTQWGFKGFVVADYTGILEMSEHGVGDMQTSSAMALNAGVDMDMVTDGLLTTTAKSIAEGKVTMETVDNAVYRMLSAKYDLGLFENPYKNCDENRAKTEIATPESKTFARKVAAESMVLLKNDNQILPLKKTGTIAVIGSLAQSNENMGGTWSVATKHDTSKSLLDGLKTVVGDKVKVTYAKGSNLDYDAEFEARGTMFGKAIKRDNRTKEELIKEALDASKNADVILAVLGEGAEMSGECSSRTNLEIPQSQKDLLTELLKTGKPVVLVLFTGRPLVLVDENASVPAILNVWFPGSEAGLAISDILFGDMVPSGKLTATWPRSVGQIPIYYSHKNTGRPLGNEEGKFEKYKSNYIDERNEPLYPFGYGLSYTKFEYSNVKISSKKMTATQTITVSVEVKNTGNYDAKEIVQLYTRDVVGSITRPVKELKGFQKVAIKKGETKTVSFTIAEEDLKFYNQNLDFVAEPGTFEVFIGANSDTKNKEAFELVK